MGISDSYKKKEHEERQTAIVKRLKRIVVEQLSVEESDVIPSARWVDLCLDTVDLAELISSIEEEFSSPYHRIEILDEDAEKIITVQDAIDYLVGIGVESIPVVPAVKKSEPVAKKFTPLTIHATSSRWQVGYKIQNRYEIHHILGGPGKSGMGIVYVCYDHKFKVPVAIKTLQDQFLQDRDSIDRFKWEAEAWVRLEKHYNIVQAMYVQEIEGKPCIELEYIAGSEQYGRDLSGWIWGGGLTFPLNLNFAIQFCHGMIHAESKFREMGRIFVHRDIKPSNILITNDRVVKVTDFGLVKAFAESSNDISLTTNGEESRQRLGLSKSGSICGTPPYMSPEQCRGASVIDTRADVYSFGCVLYEMVTGRPPFQARTMGDYVRHHLSSIPEIPDTEKWLKKVIMKCLEKDPNKRYQNFSVVEEVLSKPYHQLTGEVVRQPEAAQLEVWELSNKGLSLNSLSLHEEAVACLMRAVKLDPNNPDTHGNLGIIYAGQGNHEAAVLEYQESLRIDPNNATAHCNLGLEYADQGNHEAAVLEYQASLRIDPNNATTHCNLGAAFDHLKNLDAAVEEYKKALRINPNDANVHCYLGMAYDHQKNFDAAAEEYKETLRINPRCAKAHAGIGGIYYNRFRFVRSEKEYKLALSINPNDAEVHCNLGVLYQIQAKLVEAQEEYKEALRINPNFAFARYKWGSAYLDAHQIVGKPLYLDAAVEQFKEALRIDPHNAGWHYDLGDTYSKLLNYATAVQEYKEALSINLNLVWAHYRLGLAYQALGKIDAAVEEYKETLRIDPDIAVAHYYLGDAYFDQGKSKEALGCYQEYIRLAPHHWYERELYMGTAEDKIRQLKQNL